jgi:hypothetical protein
MLRILSYFLMTLGALSGLALFILSVTGSPRLQPAMRTLWGLFAIGLAAGIALYFLSNH